MAWTIAAGAVVVVCDQAEAARYAQQAQRWQWLDRMLQRIAPWGIKPIGPSKSKPITGDG